MTLQMATTRTRLSHQRLHLQLHRSPPLTRLRHAGTGTHHATAQRRAPRRWRPRRSRSPLPLRRPRPAARLRTPRHPLRVRVRRAPPVRGTALQVGRHLCQAPTGPSWAFKGGDLSADGAALGFCPCSLKVHGSSTTSRPPRNSTSTSSRRTRQPPPPRVSLRIVARA